MKNINPRAATLEAFLLAQGSVIEMRQADIAANLQCSPATIRRAGRVLAESGRWEVKPGVGHQASTYRFLEAK